jgi:MATE family multidrug resistance protein
MTKYPMYATILANVVNVILNYILIFGKFGFPEFGIVGAAYGTVISRFIMLWHLWFLLKRKETLYKQREMRKHFIEAIAATFLGVIVIAFLTFIIVLTNQ